MHKIMFMVFCFSLLPLRAMEVHEKRSRARNEEANRAITQYCTWLMIQTGHTSKLCWRPDDTAKEWVIINRVVSTSNAVRSKTIPKNQCITF